MIKKTIGAVLLVLALFVFVGCDGNPLFTTEETTETPTTETTDAPTTDAPTTDAPTTDAPTTEVPTTETPTTEAPTTEENLIDELFFSEYGEGSSNNKWLEIYNGTGEIVDLSIYTIKIYYNGSATAGGSINLQGTIDNFDVFVLAHSASTQAILDNADMQSGSLTFNGDDAVTLSKGGTVIDLIGTIGDENNFAQDVTLVRKDSVISPTITWDINEWESYSADTFEYIGFHTDVQPDDSVLLQQDVDDLQTHIDLIGDFDFGTGSNGSTYSIQLVTGAAADYVTYVDGSNYIESTLTTTGEFTGEITVEVSLGDLDPVTKLISLTVKNSNLNTDTNPQYYSSISDGLSGETLIAALNVLLNDTYSGVDYGAARYILDESDADPNNPDNVILVYTRSSVSGVWDGGATWNREHVWPQSLLNEDAYNGINSATDLHNLKPSYPSENSSRGNKYYDNIGSAEAYEPHDDVKGDVARILFYMMVMYDDLTLVNTTPTTYEMALLDILLTWHVQDPVDDFELNRNNVIYSYQGNRNPFIDNPEYVSLIWNDESTN